ncbi:hypothetical protein DCCM_4563 [Desulfocucumis palustris]|uniref:Uncharacterized protein n=1 Tax=Desulfocucumis palustris TaxID=1898651 RepID=A0A2L2XM83_9FIRM|nr:hypothetical protein DCCM_4563 [Desulfocucumis palustris]
MSASNLWGLSVSMVIIVRRALWGKASPAVIDAWGKVR